MAKRPAWCVQNSTVICKQFEFEWSGGFAISQKQKNIKALHEAIFQDEHKIALEISSKGVNPIGNCIGAFSLKLEGVCLENVFQAAKKYELGGPYIDLLEVSPKEAKGDDRHNSSGKLIAFVKDGKEWALTPKTAFYDYIYINALLESYGTNLDLSDYNWFTDIEFNPKKSINCQARAVAVYKLLQQKNNFNIVKSNEKWILFHEKCVKG